MMRTFLVLSVALNGVLAAFLAYGLRTRGTPGQVLARPTAAVSPAIAKPKAAAPPTPDAAASAAARILSWRDIESPDFKQYIANLRRIGCPEETIAEVIISEVNGTYRARLAQLPTAKRPEYKYWVTRGDWQTWLRPKLDPEAEIARAQIEAEKRELLKQLLGPAYAAYDCPDKTALRWEQDPFFAGLPAQKRGEVLAVTQQYDQQITDLRDHRRSFMDDDDRQELARLQQAKEQAVAAILTPAELEEFQLRFSDVAQRLRENVLPRIDVSEQEFRALVSAQKETLQVAADARFAAPDMAAEKAARLKRIDDALRAQLGDERYAAVTVVLGR